eukprot:CAMPEP_0197850404 /NCGR_PEP_ID=MMETSP1438-20131217/15297_1 /TAXON_ID=1461541 /ORGANISM="Pterosperma sp., Strain CCMP1384" /LENGTH=173 /DNA_ID=CAMNT_0043463557 /DNA_START=176 /DNA_END=694 /DNA_ORIENTATION=+
MGKDISDWANYEVLLPRPSHSLTGRFADCKANTIPHVRTILRAQAYERTVTRDKQANRDSALSKPKKLNAPPGEIADARKAEKLRIANSKGRVIPNQGNSLSKRYQLPALPPRAPQREHTSKLRQSESEKEEQNEKYSETPIHKRQQSNKVFDLPEFVAQERAIITAGRTFTW